MALAKQIVDLPLVGGVNDSEDQALTLRPTEMINCRYSKSGSVSKRYGYTALSVVNRRLGTLAVPPAPDLIAPFGDELLRFGEGELDSFKTVGGTSDWVYRDRASRCALEETAIATVLSPGVYPEPDVAYSNGYLVTAYVSVNVTGAQTEVCVDVREAATGTVVLSRYVVSSGSNLAATKVATTGNTVGVFWFDASGLNVQGRFLDTSTMTWGSVGVCNANVLSGKYDVGVKDSTHWCFIAEAPGGLGAVFWSNDTTVTAGAFGLTGGRTYFTGPITGVDASAIKVDAANNRLWFSICVFAGGNRITYIATANATTFAIVGAPTALSTVATTRVGRTWIEVAPVNSSFALIGWDVANEHAYWTQVSVDGGGTFTDAYAGSPRSILYASWTSRLLKHDDRCYALVLTNHSVAGTYALVDLWFDESIPSGASARIEAVATPRQVYAPLPSNVPRNYGIGSWASAGTGDYYVPTLSTTVTQSTTTNLLRVKFDSLWRRTVTTTNDTCTVSGGAVSVYDRNEVAEVGFLYEPDTYGLSALSSAAGSGGLKQSKQYGYCYVFVWTDSLGRVHRSAPSAPRFITTTASGADDVTVGVSVPQLHLTNKSNTSNVGSGVLVFVFRTEGNGSVYYLNSVLRNNVGTASQSYNDAMTDAVLSTRQRLYTTGGVLDNVIPPSATIVHVWKNAALLAGTPDDSIWVSKALVDGEGLGFNDDLVIPAFDGGRVTGLATLDATLVVFKQDGIWAVQGEPPNDLGQSSLSTPQRIHSDVGCTDPYSVVATPEGIMFMSRAGLCLLDRGFNVSKVGRPVEDAYVDAGFAGAVSVPEQNAARFVQRAAASEHAALNYDHYQSALAGSAVWSRDRFTDGYAVDLGDDDHAHPISACSYRGKVTWISAAGGLYQEDSSTRLDSGGGLTTYVSSAFASAFDKPLGPQGFHRVWRVSVLGKKVTDHALTVTLESDLGTQSVSWTSAEVNALSGLPNEQVQVHSQYQKVQRMRVRVVDATPTSNVGTGEGMVLRGIQIQLGVKGGPKLPSGNKR